MSFGGGYSGGGGGLSYTSAGTTNYLPKFDGSGFVNSGISDDGTTILLGRKAQVNSTAIGNVPFTVNGFSGQTANLFEAKVNGGSAVISFAPDGAIFTAAVSHHFHGSTPTVSNYTLTANTTYTMINAASVSGGVLFKLANAQKAFLEGSAKVMALASDYQFAFTNSTSGFTGTQDTGLARAAAGVVAVTNGATGIRGLLGGGAAVASAAALPLPTGRVFHVTGTTNITSITSTNFQSGAVITLIFDGALTFTDGSNLKLAGNFATAADSTITLVYDGSNWFEIARSTN